MQDCAKSQRMCGMSLRQTADGAAASSPKAWIAALGGEGVIERSYAEWPSLGIGYFRFDDLTEPLAAPAIDRHSRPSAQDQRSA